MTGDIYYHDGSGGQYVSNIMKELLDRADELEKADNWVAGPPMAGQQCLVYKYADYELTNALSNVTREILNNYCQEHYDCTVTDYNDFMSEGSKKKVIELLRACAADYGADMLAEMLEEKRASMPVSGKV